MLCTFHDSVGTWKLNFERTNWIWWNARNLLNFPSLFSVKIFICQVRFFHSFVACCYKFRNSFDFHFKSSKAYNFSHTYRSFSVCWSRFSRVVVGCGVWRWKFCRCQYQHMSNTFKTTLLDDNKKKILRVFVCFHCISLSSFRNRQRERARKLES